MQGCLVNCHCRAKVHLLKGEGEGEGGRGRGRDAVTLRAVVKVTVTAVKRSGNRGRKRPGNDPEPKVLSGTIMGYGFVLCFKCF